MHIHLARAAHPPRMYGAPTLREAFGERFLLPRFDDVTNPDARTALSPGLAHETATFVTKWESLVPRIYFACDGGISRSAALSAATMLHLGRVPEGILGDARKHPDELVFERMLMAFGLDPEGELPRDLITKNEEPRHQAWDEKYTRIRAEHERQRQQSDQQH